MLYFTSMFKCFVVSPGFWIFKGISWGKGFTVRLSGAASSSSSPFLNASKIGVLAALSFKFSFQIETKRYMSGSGHMLI